MKRGVGSVREEVFVVVVVVVVAAAAFFFFALAMHSGVLPLR